MNEEPDPLESELAAFPPQPISPDFEERIAARMAASAQRRRRARYWSALIAACLVAGFWLGWNSARPLDRNWPPTRPPVVPTQESLPTLQALRRAAAQSPDDFDALLDRWGVRTLEAQGPVPTAFTPHRDEYFGQ